MTLACEGHSTACKRVEEDAKAPDVTGSRFHRSAVLDNFRSHVEVAEIVVACVAYLFILTGANGGTS